MVQTKLKTLKNGNAKQLMRLKKMF